MGYPCSSSFSSYLGLHELEVADLNQVLHLVNEVREADSRHVHEASGAIGVYWRPLGLSVFLEQLGRLLEGVGGVRVEALHKADLVLDLLQLVAVGEVSVALQLVVHDRQALNEGLALAVTLGLGRWAW
jgi:hypothetical protein